MKKIIINSRFVRVLSFLFGFLLAFLVVWVGDYNIINGEAAVAFLFIFMGVMAFTVMAVWKQDKQGFFLQNLVKIDYSFLALTMLLSFIIGLQLINFHILPNVITSFAVYTISYFLLVTSAAHIREKTLFKAFHLFGFLKNHRKNRVYFCVCIMAFASLIALYAAFNTVFFSFFVFLFITAYVSLAAFCYLCKYLMSLSEEYDKAVEERMKSERVKIELISNVSHDLRTPLTSIINYIDLIKRLGIENDSLNEYLAVLGNKSERMKTLANDLIEASKAGAGDITVSNEQIDLAELTGQVAGEFDSLMSEAGLTFVYNAPQNLPINADGKQLWRVMENIFGNAVKYSLNGTRVYCFVGVLDGKAVFSLKNVSKEPLNISPDELTERFVRGDAARTGEGSGLGLYIAKALAELMGARFVIGISGDLFEASLEFKNCASAQ